MDTMPTNHQSDGQPPIGRRRTRYSLFKLKKFSWRWPLKLKKLSRKTWRIIASAAVVVVLLVAGWWLWQDLTAPVKIGKIETTNALSSRVKDADVKNQFKAGEPVMLHFEYSGAKVGAAVSFTVKNQDGKTVRQGSTTVLRPTGSDQADGQRYVSIVNTGSTTLPGGKYTVTLSMGGRTVKTVRFEIK